MSSKRLLLIDVHSLAYRAFYALPVENFVTSSGQHTNAIYGLASMLINLINTEKPTHIAAAFDVSRKTFRSEKFPEYKANRASTPDEFRSQAEFLHQLVDSFGVKSFAVEGYEADDLIATLTKKAENEGFEIFICTGDRDSFQLVSNQTTVLYPKKGVTELARITPEALYEKYGLTPSQYPDFAALRGDPSDNLPSIPGVGEKTAAKWIIEYGTLEKLIKSASEIQGKAGESLKVNLKSVLLNHELTHLNSKVGIDSDIEKLTWHGVKEKEILQLFDQLEIKALRERIRGLLSNTKATRTNPKKNTKKSVEISSEELSKIITSPVAVDFDLVEGNLKAYSVYFESGETYIVRTNGIESWLEDPSIEKYLHNSKRFSHWHELNGVKFDTELAAYLINAGSRSLELSDLSQKYLDEQLPDSDELFSEFNSGSVEIIWRLVPILQKELNERGMLKLFEKLELPLLNILARMERTGVAVDKVALEKEFSFFKDVVETETQAAHKSVNKEFNVNSPKQLQTILFDDLKLPKTKRNKTGFTTDAESLEWLHNQSGHPLLKHLLRIRETSKLLSVIEGLINSISSDDRIHTEFQQTVAATGRLSSTNPNLQNIPIRTEEGKRIRTHFIPQKPYTKILTADYSQIELRIMAHLSKDKELIAAFKSGEDLHSTMASLVFGVLPSEVDPEMRRKIKAMSYGLAYGLSTYGLAAQLNISPGEASELMGKYMERFGGIQEYLKSVVKEAKKVGYTETMFGRRRYLADLNQENRVRREIAERAALNAPMQGSAADIIKFAMLNFERLSLQSKLKSRLILQVHDELIFEVASGEEQILESIVREAMGTAAKLDVDLDVNVGIGTSWADAAH